MISILEYIRQHQKDFESIKNIRKMSRNQSEPFLQVESKDVQSGAVPTSLSYTILETQGSFVQDEELYLIVVPDLLDNYKEIVEINYIEEESGFFFCKPLSFNLFFQECKGKLEFVFKTVFKKEKVFNELLLEICETEIR